MPCNSDYLAASGQELESQRVCMLIHFVNGRINRETPPWIVQAEADYYGNVNRLDEATKILCGLCRSLTAEEADAIIYDARTPLSRKLADWWERHQEWDARRVKEEEESRKLAVTRERALKKLSVEEMKALGLVG